MHCQGVQNVSPNLVCCLFVLESSIIKISAQVRQQLVWIFRMFPSSTHRKFWTFKSEEEVVESRQAANDKFVARHKSSTVDFLSHSDSELLLDFFERKLLDFCLKFKPPMPRSVIGTTFHYFKRFYLNNSVMDYHPKEIL